MGLIRGAIKAGVAAKVLQVVRREASKPENQRKAKELLGRIGSQGGSGKQRGRR